MQRYDYVLFDADNTLFDFDRAERQALTRTLEYWGFPITEAARNCYLTANRALWSAYDRGEVTKDFLVVERFAALQREFGGDRNPAEVNDYYLARLAEGGMLLPGAEALCRTLASHCTLAIITNGVSSAQRGRFSRSAVKDLIPYLFISGDMACQKPQKIFFDQVLDRMGISNPARCVVVGDSLAADIQGAMNAGLDSVWYAPGGQAAPPEFRPTYIARDFDEVRRLVLGY